MAPSILGSALSDSLWQAEQTPWGMSASAVSQAVPALYNPMASNSRNFWMTLGGGILSTVLAGLGRNQADERNVELYGGFQRLEQATSDAERQAIVKEFPRLTNVAFAMRNQENETQRNIRERIAGGIAQRAALANFGQGGANITRGLTDYVLGKTSALPVDAVGAEQIPATRFEEPKNEIEALIPENPVEYQKRIFNELSQVQPPTQAAVAARQETERIYGDVSKIRLNTEKEFEESAKALAAIDTMKEMLPDLGEEGPIAEWMLPLRKTGAAIAREFGSKEKADQLERQLRARSSYNSAAADLVATGVQAYKPASNTDVLAVERAVGMIKDGATKAEAAAALKVLEKAKENRMQYIEAKNRWINENQTDQNFVQVYKMYAEDQKFIGADGKPRKQMPFYDWLETKKGRVAKVVAERMPQETEQVEAPMEMQATTPTEQVPPVTGGLPQPGQVFQLGNKRIRIVPSR